MLFLIRNTIRISIISLFPSHWPKRINMSTSNPPYGPAVYHTPTHVFFYGYELQLSEARLQNWYPASFSDPKHPKIRFPTNEHYIMWRKAMAMDDSETASKILVAATPTEAQRLGREVRNYKPEVWQALVDQVAEDGNWFKFSQVEECKAALLATGDKKLAEASPVDRNWGIGFRGDEAEGNEAEWGKNILGKALERVRKRLRKEGKTRFNGHTKH